jgi:hypothetical protein
MCGPGRESYRDREGLDDYRDYHQSHFRTLRITVRPAQDGVTVDIIKRRGPTQAELFAVALQPSASLLSPHGRSHLSSPIQPSRVSIAESRIELQMNATNCRPTEKPRTRYARRLIHRRNRPLSLAVGSRHYNDNVKTRAAERSVPSVLRRNTCASPRLPSRLTDRLCRVRGRHTAA